MDVRDEFWVRVLLFEGIKKCTVKSRSELYIIDAKARNPVASFSKAGPDVEISSSKYGFFVNNRKVSGSQLLVKTNSPYVFGINGVEYRGKLKLIHNADGSFDAINLVPLEPYLSGVVGAEMPDYWEASALETQAIAARTYCLYIKKRFGVNRRWDVKKTQASQAYHGIAAESARIQKAVDKTYGLVLVCRYGDGSEDVFPAYYSSVCGGHTENHQNVFGGESLEPLVGVKCRYCKYTARTPFYYWPMVQFDKKMVSEKILKKYPKLKNLGKVVKLAASKKSVHEDEYITRMTMVKVSGSTGKEGFLRGEDLRLTVDPSGYKIKSTICEIVDMGEKWAFISGRGFGHGVGMCQHGAQGMARRGKRTSEILMHYYPGSTIKSIY
ncbi:MAG: SpoIID/LytB domain-containing protein [Planctomycetes bacterium]|nr:SpoIID/LytB domain-containing protein [Planctomycetota bacterium]